MSYLHFSVRLSVLRLCLVCKCQAEVKQTSPSDWQLSYVCVGNCAFQPRPCILGHCSLRPPKSGHCCLPHSQLQTSVGEVAHGNPIGSAITSATCLTCGSVGFSCPSLYFLFLFLLPLPLPCAEPSLRCGSQYAWIPHPLSLPFPSLPPHRCQNLFVARWFTQVLP